MHPLPNIYYVIIYHVLIFYTGVDKQNLHPLAIYNSVALYADIY